MMPPSMAADRPEQSNVASLKVETIEELFAALESPLLQYALRLVHQNGVAEEIVQEAFLRLHAGFAEVLSPRRWLYRTVHNLSLNHRRSASKLIPLAPASPNDQGVQLELPDPEPLPDEQIARSEAIGLVRLSLATLDDRSRELIRLKFNEGLSYQAISARTGLSVGHVGYLLHHALKAIAAELSRRGGMPG